MSEESRITGPQHSTVFAKHAWGLLSLRLGSVCAVSVLMWLGLKGAQGTAAFPPTTMWATLGLLPVNAVCLVVVAKLYRQQQTTLRQALGIQRGRIFKDVLWGLLWLIVMNIPFTFVVAGTVFLLYGANAPEAFATIFVDPDVTVQLAPTVWMGISLIAVLPFMVLNAPTEELVFRGYGLAGLERRWGAGLAIVATSILFGLQHIFFAASLPGMLVFFLAFTVWGMTAALIVRKQGRLFPVVIAHYIINIALSAPAIVLPILQLSGVLEIV